MAYVDPKLAYYFEELPINVKNAVLELDVQVNSLDDLILALQKVISEGC